MDKVKILVCGGRNYGRKEDGEYDPVAVEKTYGILDYIIEAKFPHKPDVEIISGMAKGADMIGFMYAAARNYTVDSYPAKWHEHGKSAGAIRNRQMLMEGHPDLVIAFEGGAGTKHMKNIALDYGVDVLEVERVKKG